MTTIAALGEDPKSYYTKSKISTVTTPYTAAWSPQLQAPFGVYGKILGASKTSTSWVAVSNNGMAAFCIGPQPAGPWTSYYLNDPMLQFNCVRAELGSTHVAVGYQKDPTTRAEYAVIATTTSGYDVSTWQERWLHTDEYSGLYDITNNNTSAWWAAGYQNNFTSPLLVYSHDQGASWGQVTLPSTINGALYSVSYTSSTQVLRLGGNGFIAVNNNNIWTVNNTIKINNRAKAITRLVDFLDITGNQISVALSGDTIWYSNNLYDYSSVSVPGYTFRDVIYDSGTWIFSATSRLNQFTGFTGVFSGGSNLSLTLTGYNNGVHASRLIRF